MPHAVGLKRQFELSLRLCSMRVNANAQFFGQLSQPDDVVAANTPMHIGAKVEAQPSVFFSMPGRVQTIDLTDHRIKVFPEVLLRISALNKTAHKFITHPGLGGGLESSIKPSRVIGDVDIVADGCCSAADILHRSHQRCDAHILCGHMSVNREGRILQPAEQWAVISETANE